MDCQYFGRVFWNDSNMEAMLCMDSDKPHEVMLHVWTENNLDNAGGVKLGLKPIDGGFSGTVTGVFRPKNGGEIDFPPLSPQEIENFSKTTVTIKVSEEGIEGRWQRGPVGGDISLNHPFRSLRVDSESLRSWADFKEWASAARLTRNIAWFRGHGCSSFKLSTTLARAKRMRLELYCGRTLREFQRHVEALTGNKVDLSNLDDYGVALGLAQHHGLPTPLLDWTRSAYVAAFFAFADAIESGRAENNHGHVRVYGITREFLEICYSSVVTVPYCRPYLCPLDISPRNNPRLYAQQGQFFVTNVGDVEGYIGYLEKKMGKKYLYAVDIPNKCAAEALEDLDFMGLNAATMFPGLDGVCRMMKHSMMKVNYGEFTPGKPKGIVDETGISEGNM